jgi:hypothetical protein
LRLKVHGDVHRREMIAFAAVGNRGGENKIRLTRSRDMKWAGRWGFGDFVTDLRPRTFSCRALARELVIQSNSPAYTLPQGGLNSLGE